MKDYATTRFTRRIRITPENLEHIRRVKGKYTLAGMLDKIINEYKREAKTEKTKKNQHTQVCDQEVIHSLTLDNK